MPVSCRTLPMTPAGRKGCGPFSIRARWTDCARDGNATRCRKPPRSALARAPVILEDDETANVTSRMVRTGPLSNDQLARYECEGFLLVRDLLARMPSRACSVATRERPIRYIGVISKQRRAQEEARSPSFISNANSTCRKATVRGGSGV
jgi:hypothetical protein